jgi:hypothetical protein
MKEPLTQLSIGLSVLILVVSGARAQSPAPPALPSPRYTITLGGRDACVTPHTRNRARADGGIIDVQTASPSSDALTVTMTGTTAADSYLGCTSTATQSFHLVQEFEVTCSDPTIQSVTLTFESSLVGYVRSARKAGASVKLASASVVPESWAGSPVTLAHQSLSCSGTQAHLCNQHLPPLQGPPMPLGRFTLVADFVLDTTASGICNAHAVADFSPDTTLPADWVRMRDPFQGVSKKAFGFSFSLSAGAPSGPASLAGARAGYRPLSSRADRPRGS